MVPIEDLRKYFEAADISQSTMESLAKISSRRELVAGDIVFREHEISDTLYIVVSGQVDVQYLLKSGKRKSFDTLGPGDFLVWSAVVKPHKTMSIGICRSKTELIAIEAAPLRQLCEEDCRFGYRLVSQLAQSMRNRLKGARRELADFE
jgi:CRP-like cAMP-binding protein